MKRLIVTFVLLLMTVAPLYAQTADCPGSLKAYVVEKE